MLIKKIDLNMFNGGAAGGGAAAGASAGSGADTGTATGETGSETGEKIVYQPKNKKANKLDNVVYGSQQDSSDAGNFDISEDSAAEEMSPEDRFNELIKGDYKQQYQDNVQQIINKRFKETKALEAQLDSYSRLATMLEEKYGVDPGDIESLTNAIENDDSVWEQKAYENDMDVDQYKAFRKLEMENEALLREQQSRLGQEQAMRQLDDWNRQAEELKKTFPGFDLNEEAKNPEFLSLLRHHIPVEKAYKTIHLDEILNSQAETVAKQAEMNVVNNIKAKGRRPSENGTVSQSGFTYKSDVRNLTKADRAEIARRAARGENITFR